jgi:hypothetical protein
VEERRNEWIAVWIAVITIASAVFAGFVVAEAADSRHSLNSLLMVGSGGVLAIGLYFVFTPLLHWWPFRRRLTAAESSLPLTVGPPPGAIFPTDPRTLGPDEPERQKLREKFGLRALRPLEVGTPTTSAPNGTFFFLFGFGLTERSLFAIGRLADYGRDSEDTEMWKTTSGAQYFLAYVSEELAELLATWEGPMEKFNAFLMPWAENTRLVALSYDAATKVEYRSFQYDRKLFELTMNPTYAGQAVLNFDRS